jgi:glycosyltransferase involved in cell wall biosynthesis
MSEPRSDAVAGPIDTAGLLMIGNSSVAFDGETAHLSAFFKDYGERLAASLGPVDWLLPLHGHGLAGRFPVHAPQLRVHGYTKTAPLRFWRFLGIFHRHRRALVSAVQAIPFLPLLLFFHFVFGLKLYVYASNNFLFEVERYQGQGKHLRAFLWLWGTRLLLRRASGVIARGRFLHDECRKYNRNCTITIPLGNMHHMARSAVSGAARHAGGRLVFLGRVQEGKGVDVLLQAFAALRAADDGRATVRRLTIIGTGSAEAACRELAERLGIADAVEFAGYVGDPEEIAARLREAALLVVPTTAFPEGVPRAIEEAMTLHVPVVATAVGGVPAEFDDGSVTIVPPGDVAALRDGIRRVLATPESYAAAVAAVERRMDGIHWRNPADQHAAFVTTTERAAAPAADAAPWGGAAPSPSPAGCSTADPPPPARGNVVAADGGGTVRT